MTTRRLDRGQSVVVTSSDAPRYRVARASKLVAALLLTITAAFAIWTVADEGASGIGGVVAFIAVASFTAVVLRVEVRAEPTALVINSGWRVRRIPWGQLSGFCVEEGRGQRRVLALVGSTSAVALPIANGGVLLTRQHEVTEIRDALDAYRISHS